MLLKRHPQYFKSQTTQSCYSHKGRVLQTTTTMHWWFSDRHSSGGSFCDKPTVNPGCSSFKQIVTRLLGWPRIVEKRKCCSASRLIPKHTFVTASNTPCIISRKWVCWSIATSCQVTLSQLAGLTVVHNLQSANPIVFTPGLSHLLQTWWGNTVKGRVISNA